MAACLQCGAPLAAVAAGPQPRFCCEGCEAAYEAAAVAPDRHVERHQPAPAEPGADLDYSAYVHRDGDLSQLHLMVEGMHCGNCVWRIESTLAKQPGVTNARVNMSTRRLALAWRGAPEDAARLLAPAAALGYRFVPFEPEKIASASKREEATLLRALAVAGFAAGNVMLLSVAVWAGAFEDMGPATRDLLHWISALIALPAIAYAGRPFFRSAVAALKAGSLNMDVPISLAVLLAAGMSLFETMQGGVHVYFDSACALLFFLLIGRFLDRRARGRARSAAEHLLALGARAVTVLDQDGSRHTLAPERVQQGMTVLAAPGERIAVDGRIVEGASDLDTSLITGETTPTSARPGDAVFAGTLNLSGPLTITARAAGADTLLAEIVRLMEAAEKGRARYVALADRIARLYAPSIHILGACTFLGWLALGGVGWQQALLYAVSVLIITCPCALGLAVPMVQVVVSGWLLRRGILIKSATALERLAKADTVVFDKTGTLTLGTPRLVPGQIDEPDLRMAAALAGASRHPLARALARAADDMPVAKGVRETPGAGLCAAIDGREVRLGNRGWCGVAEDDVEALPELWLKVGDRAPVAFRFEDAPRLDAREVIERLQDQGYDVALLSGDRQATVSALAERLGIDHWRASCTPEEKCAALADMAEEGRRVLMVGDGLNDAPALAAALVSASPSSAADISQTAADVVFQGDKLAPVLDVLGAARRADQVIKQNFAMAFVYNAVTVPLAVLGFVTPLVAAIAMSSSSLMVVANASRLARRGKP